ncbi:hypothetical protein FocTR4_00000315 [Fusarium oxysporum f. sp. cubense]|uniref:Oxidoreductase n=1 Tax=Fusarium oxysporum f. sp. cubense TaxID=61366 RepID=A0A5C6T2M3_FUSOC|nr:hypothetical protein FocTR4_00000315 [Fusarium oxysporum f. sp. cubense]
MSTVQAYPFDPTKDIPSLTGKVIFITGANTGLGKATAIELAKHSPAHIYITSRNSAKGNAALEEVKKTASEGIKASLLELDLSSFESIKSAAAEFLKREDKLDVLLLNAGVMGAPPTLTKDGYEMHMGTNHLGHALLLKLLKAVLDKTPDARAVHLSSAGFRHVGPAGIEFDTLKSAKSETALPYRYAQSKLACLLYAREASKRYPNFKNIAINPGEVQTELFTREAGDDLMKHLQENVASKVAIPITEGVKNHLWATTAPDIENGEFYEPVGKTGGLEGHGLDDEMAKRLWDWTEEQLKDQVFDMSDLLSIVGSAVGIISLGIHVCQGLISYLQSFKGQVQEIQDSVKETQTIVSLLNSVTNVLVKLDQHSARAIAVVDCWKDSEKRQRELQGFLLKLQKPQDTSQDTPQRIKNARHVLAYPFLQGKLSALRQCLQDLLHNLNLAVKNASLDLTTDIYDQVHDISDTVKGQGLQIAHLSDRLLTLDDTMGMDIRHISQKLSRLEMVVQNLRPNIAVELMIATNNLSQVLSSNQQLQQNFHQRLTGCLKEMVIERGLVKELLDSLMDQEIPTIENSVTKVSNAPKCPTVTKAPSRDLPGCNFNMFYREMLGCNTSKSTRKTVAMAAFKMIHDPSSTSGFARVITNYDPEISKTIRSETEEQQNFSLLEDLMQEFAQMLASMNSTTNFLKVFIWGYWRHRISKLFAVDPEFINSIEGSEARMDLYVLPERLRCLLGRGFELQRP